MKLSYEQKVQIYKEWKYKHKSANRLSREYKIDRSAVQYFCGLAEYWGIEKLKHTCTYYSSEFKKATIEQVLNEHKAIWQVAIDLGLPNQGTLANWIREYIANGYTVIERKRGMK